MKPINTGTFRISPITGRVSWDDYDFSIDLTHDEFAQRHPQLTPRYVFTLGGLEERSYQFPAVKVSGISRSLLVTFFNQRLGAILVEKKPSEVIKTEDLSRRKLAWLIKAREFLRQQLGEPTRTSEAALHGEEAFLSKDYLSQLQNWHYLCAWGQVDFTHESESWDDVIGISYDEFQQVRNWDELIEEWSCRVNLLRASHENIPPGLMDVPSVIDFLRPHFSYSAVHPRVDTLHGGLTFNILNQNTPVFLDIDPDRAIGVYKIDRADTTRQDYANKATLVETLRVFLESESL